MSTTAKPETEVQKFQARVAETRERDNKLIEWHLNLHLATGFELPWGGTEQYLNANVRHYNYETGEYEYDTEATLKQLSKIVKYANSQGYKIKKSYEGDFSISIYIDPTQKHFKVTYSTKRDLVCTKRVVGTKVTPATTIPERVEEIVEWDCDPISLLAVDTDD